jgi:hypothetical protein
VPELEASEESLRQFSAGRAPDTAAAPAPAEPPPAASYPPLEAPLR